MSRKHVVLNLTEDEATALGHIIDRVDGHNLGKNEVVVKEKVESVLTDRDIR